MMKKITKSYFICSENLKLQLIAEIKNISFYHFVSLNRNRTFINMLMTNVSTLIYSIKKDKRQNQRCLGTLIR